MKKIIFTSLVAVVCATSAGHAGYSNRAFRKEVSTGLDIVSARLNIETPDAAPGELGLDVYQTVGVARNDDVRLFIPTSMYVRGGAGMNLGFATDRVRVDDEKYETRDSYAVQIGLGWNLSSYVRTEIGFQTETLKFKHIADNTATYNMLNAMLYFDFARRYVQTGDITHRRRFVPFMGIGAGAGAYKFDGAGGADGLVIGAPRAELGFNVMLTELIGIDIAYQYQMMIGNGFGWDTRRGGVNNVSNIMASFRANF